MNLTAIKNSIIFQFVDKVNSKGEFVKQATESGIEFSTKHSSDDSAKLPRWANVLSAGPECEFVKPGYQVLLPALRWTAASTLNNEQFWKTDESQVAVMRETKTSDLVPLGTTLVVKRVARGLDKSTIIYVASDNTPKAVVKLLGPKCVPELKDSIVLYNDVNVFEDFVHCGETFTFLKEEDIIAYVLELEAP